MITKLFYHPSPSLIMGQVACCNSMEEKDPPFQARMVGVHILDMVETGPAPESPFSG